MAQNKVCITKDRLCTNRRQYGIIAFTFILLALVGFSIVGYAIKNHPNSDGKVWVEVSIFPQCSYNPLAGKNVDLFFEFHGILPYQTKITNRTVCHECGCPNPQKIEILIADRDYQEVIRALASGK